MSILEIPIDTTFTSFTQETTLDGKTYLFLFRWNAREGFWYLTLSTSEGVLILSSLKLVPGAALLRHSVDWDLRPPGELIVVDPSGTVGEPGRDDLGSKVHLIYLDEEEVTTPTTGTVVDLGSFVVEAEMRIATPAGSVFAGGSVWQKLSGVFEAGILNGFTYVDGRLTYIGTEERTFLVNVSTAFTTSGAISATIGISKDAADPTDEQTITQKIATTVDFYPVSLGHLVTLQTNQFIELWGLTSGAITLTLEQAQVTLIG